VDLILFQISRINLYLSGSRPLKGILLVAKIYPPPGLVYIKKKKGYEKNKLTLPDRDSKQQDKANTTGSRKLFTIWASIL
jgi:hypothetical protein